MRFISIYFFALLVCDKSTTAHKMICEADDLECLETLIDIYCKEEPCFNEECFVECKNRIAQRWDTLTTGEDKKERRRRHMTKKQNKKPMMTNQQDEKQRHRRRSTKKQNRNPMTNKQNKKPRH
ncbi:unnamed protein product [Cylicocyclus nassatus]|uniref:Uncharacterized protein n=1 Tax=Cylicocyclus nassatus TaxID=53992 RepID=A0AA36DU98_CYLNA|nr:unnamed protein product [Cylicocyclus nassatus]